MRAIAALASRRVFVKGAGLVGAGLFPSALGAKAKIARTLSVNSPDGTLTATLFLPDRTSRVLRWSAKKSGREIVRSSQMSLVLGDGTLLGPRATLVKVSRKRIDGDWSPPYGVAARYDGTANQLEAIFVDRVTNVRFAVRLLAHNDGVAYRHVILSAPGGKLTLGGEASEFSLPVGTELWSSRDEGDYARSLPGRLDPVPVPELTRSTDKGALADTPLLAMLSGGRCLLITESDRPHYPRLMIAPGADAHSLRTHLMRLPGRATGYSGPGDTHAAPLFDVRAPFLTPWRLVVVADKPAQLIEKAHLVTTLAEPNRLGDVSWIRPGRAYRVPTPFTNERARMGIALAEKRKLDYIEFDAHWYGDGTDPSDATKPIAGFDLPQLIAEARGKGIGTIVYVDRVPAMRQLDAIVARYKEWGVAGIKFGFIWEGRQEDADFIYNLVETCGRSGLLVNLHDNLRPAGLERTLPNYIALEGVRGNEQFPSATHNVTLPFIRGAVGPADYTICYAHAKNRTTNAHQLAMAVVYYSPLTFLYWYDQPDKYLTREWPELAWFDQCPTTWHETRALDGKPGEHVVVARRNGTRWFLGAMTNEQARTVKVPLSFLGRGNWRATRYMDGSAAGEPRNTPVQISSQVVTSTATLELVLAASGGQAVLFEQVS